MKHLPLLTTHRESSLAIGPKVGTTVERFASRKTLKQLYTMTDKVLKTAGYAYDEQEVAPVMKFEVPAKKQVPYSDILGRLSLHIYRIRDEVVGINTASEQEDNTKRSAVWVNRPGNFAFGGGSTYLGTVYEHGGIEPGETVFMDGGDAIGVSAVIDRFHRRTHSGIDFWEPTFVAAE